MRTIDASNDWIMDSGCTTHICNNKALFTEMVPCKTTIATAGNPLKVTQKGTTKATFSIYDTQHNTITEQPWTFTDTLYIPDCPLNLLSQSKLDKTFYITTENGYEMRQRGTHTLALTAHQVGGLYVADRDTEQETVLYAAKASLEIWHQRLGHIGIDRLKEMRALKDVTGVDFPDSDLPHFDCEICILGKAHRSHIRNKERERATYKGERFHADTCGPMQVPTIGGMTYLVMLVDCYSRKKFVILTKNKKDIKQDLKTFIIGTNNQLPPTQKIRYLHSDGGGEFISNELGKFLTKQGIQQTTSAANTPEHNGVAEKAIQTIVGSARCMLIAAGLPPRFWGDACRMSTIISNAAPTKANENHAAPDTLWNDKPTDVSRLRTFGCKVLTKDYDVKGKFSLRTREGIYMGPATGGDGYRIFMTDTHAFICTRDAYFLEQKGKPKIIDSLIGEEGEEEISLSESYNSHSGMKDSEVYGEWTGRENLPELPKRTKATFSEAPRKANTNTTTPQTPEHHNTQTSPGEFGDNSGSTERDDSLREEADDPPLTRSNPHVTPPTLQRGGRLQELREYFNTADSLFPSDTGTGPFKRTTKQNDREKTQTTAPTRVLNREGRGQRSSVPYWMARREQTTKKVQERARKRMDTHTAMVAFPTNPQLQQLLADEVALAAHEVSAPPSVNKDPVTYREAMNRPDAAEWQAAMIEENKSLKRMVTFEYQKLPPGRRAIKSKWVYKTKRDAQNRKVRCKARMVAKGFTQKKGLDFYETFAPVARMTSARIVLSIAVHEQLELRQVDIDNAYLNGPIDTEVYMEPPEGWEWEPGYSKENGWVLRLNKGLYGIKQAGHIWNAHIHSYCLELGFVRTSADLCVYIKHFSKDNPESCEEGRIMACLHVDDFLLAGKTKQLEWFRQSLLLKFGIKWMEDIFFLGIKIDRQPNGSLALSQRHYLEQVLIDFNMQDSRPRKTPISKGSIRELIEHPEKHTPLDTEQHSKYRTIVGKLMYAMVATRPDLAFSLSFLGQFAAAPNSLHMAMAIRVLSYVRHTLDYSLHYHYTPQRELIVQGSSDSNYAENPTRKSTTGFCFFVKNCLTHWSSKLQICVATSTSVAEWFALYETVRELVPLRRTLADLGYPQLDPTIVWEDNQTVLGLLKDETHHNRTKHVDVKYHWIKEQLFPVGDLADIQYIPTDDNLADFFTKQQPLPKHEENCKLFGLCQ